MLVRQWRRDPAGARDYCHHFSFAGCDYNDDTAHHLAPVRLQRRAFELGCWVVHQQEGLVLHTREQGLRDNHSGTTIVAI
jgi:hypothetical protein